MRVEVTSDPVAFRDAVFGTLRADPVGNSVMLSVVAMWADGRMGDTRPATFVKVLDDDAKLIGTAMRTPPAQVLLGAMPPAAVGPVAETMARWCPDAPGVQGEIDQARDFAERWRTLVGGDYELGHGLRLHRLGTLRVPAATGAPRQATEDDLPLLVDWYVAFGEDVDDPSSREQTVRAAEDKLADGRTWLWEEEGGRPVSLVGHTRTQFGAARIGPVYTPAEHRGHGYASALTGHVSRRIRETGAEVCLYTDLANPTSNKIYAAIGYEPVGDFVRYRFR
jgi:GNAT superfamily N-acetyltransferase